MDENEMLETIKEAFCLLEEEKRDAGEDFEITTRTFEEAQLLTEDTGLIVRINGKKFQLSVVEDPS